MAKSKQITADEYVTAKLIETEEKLEEANLRIKTLEEDLDAFRIDFENIRKVFRIEKTADGNEFKIVSYYDPNNDWRSDTMCFSEQLDEESWSEEFKFMVNLLHLELPATEDFEEDFEDEVK